MGLKEFRDPNGEARRPEWNRPNKKAAANLKRRVKGHNSVIGGVPSNVVSSHTGNCPGSMKIPGRGA